MSFVSKNPLLLAYAQQEAAGGISRSLRFNSSDSAYLSRTPASAGNRKTWTWAGWVKRSAFGASSTIFNAGTTSSTTGYTYISFLPDDTLNLQIRESGGAKNYGTAAVFRDPSAWYHFVVAVDTSNANSSLRRRIYINGVETTTLNYNDSLTQNTDTEVNNITSQRIGTSTDSGGSLNNYLNAYLADVHFIDGQALTPSSFTEVSATTGQLVPIAYSGTYGTNGFHLPFSDNSTAAALGTDTSGNGNTWTVNNITATTTSYTTTNSITSSGGLNNPQRILDGTVDADATIPTGAAWIEFTPPVGISYSSSVEVMGSGSPDPPYNARWQLNGGSLINTVNADSWVTLATGSGTIAKIRLQTDQSGLNWRGIRVDGVILKEEAGPGIDSLVDTPTSYGTDTGAGGEVRGNYCTWNPLSGSLGTRTLSNGNLDTTNSANGNTYSTFELSSGKWYLEATLSAISGAGGATFIGFSASSGNRSGDNAQNLTPNVAYGADGSKIVDAASSSYGASYTANDVIGIALDIDGGTVAFYKNGSSQGTISKTFLGAGKGTWTLFTVAASGSASNSWSLNAGARPFAYTAPSGFKALCDTNLPAPVVAKPNTVFDTVLYTANVSGGKTISMPGGFSPDLVWIKNRDNVEQHYLADTVRGDGANKYLRSNSTNAEGGVISGDCSITFNSSSFTLTDPDWTIGELYFQNRTYVAWCWDAGTTTASNPDGSITSQVRANASAGFSIVTYTGNSTFGATIGHGLGVAPSFIITKNRDQGPLYFWTTYHASLGATKYLQLNDTAAAATQIGAWNNTTPTSSVFTLGNFDTLNRSGDRFVAYCFAPVAGYSSFGSYTGNGSADGPFVYTGFRPRWVMVKVSSATDNWWIQDAARDPANTSANRLFPNLSNAEFANSAYNVDFLSNGFKIRGTGTHSNDNGATYVYACFAESPLQYARAR